MGIVTHVIMRGYGVSTRSVYMLLHNNSREDAVSHSASVSDDTLQINEAPTASPFILADGGYAIANVTMTSKDLSPIADDTSHLTFTCTSQSLADYIQAENEEFGTDFTEDTVRSMFTALPIDHVAVSEDKTLLTARVKNVLDEDIELKESFTSIIWLNDEGETTAGTSMLFFDWDAMEGPVAKPDETVEWTGAFEDLANATDRWVAVCEHIDISAMF